jgi:hypothetical protein
MRSRCTGRPVSFVLRYTDATNILLAENLSAADRARCVSSRALLHDFSVTAHPATPVAGAVVRRCTGRPVSFVLRYTDATNILLAENLCASPSIRPHTGTQTAADRARCVSSRALLHDFSVTAHPATPVGTGRPVSFVLRYTDATNILLAENLCASPSIRPISLIHRLAISDYSGNVEFHTNTSKFFPYPT